MSQDFSKYQEGDPPGPEGLAADVVVSADTRRADRLPPGQSRTRKWPILHWKRVPTVSREEWSLFLRGEVESPATLRWSDLESMPRTRVFADFHCVTRWSRLGNLWEGVSVGALMQRVGVRPSACFVIAHGYDDGFTTNLPLADFSAEDVLLAWQHDGEAISADHGGPVRLIVPKLYAWKSAKWICGLEFSVVDRPGYWEQAGYHDHGDPWLQERHGDRW